LKLFIGVILLGLDFQWVLALPQWLWFKCEEVLGSLLICKLDEHRSLEQSLLSAAKTNCVCRAVLGKEGLNVKLRAWFLITEAFDIDGSGFGRGLCGGRVVSLLAFDLLMAFWASNLKEMAFSECGDNGGYWFKSFHTAKFAYLCN
jgi:hypothetical protein